MATHPTSKRRRRKPCCSRPSYYVRIGLVDWQRQVDAHLLPIRTSSVTGKSKPPPKAGGQFKTNELRCPKHQPREPGFGCHGAACVAKGHSAAVGRCRNKNL